MTKRKKKSRSLQRQREFCFITSCFHWWFRYKKRLRAQTAPAPAAPPAARRREGARGEGARALASGRPGVPAPRGAAGPTLRGVGERGAPYRPGRCSRRAGSEAAGLAGSRNARRPHVLTVSGRGACPGSRGQEAAFLQNAFCLSPTEPRAVATRTRGGRSAAPGRTRARARAASPRRVCTVHLHLHPAGDRAGAARQPLQHTSTQRSCFHGAGSFSCAASPRPAHFFRDDTFH